ncbi:MAG TPA: GntP family permease [Jiangellales bacterium]|nr:GntP family permease [Jiangellales bacterium]
MPDVEPTLSTGPLLLIAVGAVLLLLFLIIRVRLHAFVALILVSVLTALAARVPLGDIGDVIVGGFGTTLGSVALLVGLGAMLGKMLEVSGGAQVLADSLVRRFGDERAPLALGVAALLFGLPIFFDAGFVVFLPLVFTVARRLGGSLLTYALPVAGAFAVMHAFVPPHPGPVAAAELIGANIGLVLLFGLLIGVPTWFLGSYLFGIWMGKRIVLPVPAVLGGADEAPGSGTSVGRTGQPARPGDDEPTSRKGDDEPTSRTGDGTEPVADRTGGVRTDVRPPDGGSSVPAFGTVLLVLLLPVTLIFFNTGLSTLDTAGVVDGEEPWVQGFVLVGQTPIALLISVIVAMWLLGWKRGQTGAQVEATANSALGPVCSIILITGAGGMFGAVLRASGIGDALATSLEGIGLPVIVAAFLIAVALRVAQGSATVALTTTGGLIAPVIEATGGLSDAYLALTVIAIACGSTVLSHVNDSGFWLVGRFLGMDVKTTFKTWTAMVTLLGTIGFAIAWLLSVFV